MIELTIIGKFISNQSMSIGKQTFSIFADDYKLKADIAVLLVSQGLIQPGDNTLDSIQLPNCIDFRKFNPKTDPWFPRCRQHIIGDRVFSSAVLRNFELNLEFIIALRLRLIADYNKIEKVISFKQQILSAIETKTFVFDFVSDAELFDIDNLEDQQERIRTLLSIITALALTGKVTFEFRNNSCYKIE